MTRQYREGEILIEAVMHDQQHKEGEVLMKAVMDDQSAQGGADLDGSSDG